MEFHHKGAPGTQPVGWLPWFEVPGRKSADATIIIGTGRPSVGSTGRT